MRVKYLYLYFWTLVQRLIVLTTVCCYLFFATILVSPMLHLTGSGFRLYLSDHTQSFRFVSGTSKQLVNLTCSDPQDSIVGPKKFVAYTDNIAEKIDSFAINHHLYTDVTQLQIYTCSVDAHAGHLNIEEYVLSIKDWCSSRRLQLNANKMEIIWFGSKTNLSKLDPADMSLRSTTVECRPCRLRKKPWSLHGQWDEHECTYQEDLFSVLFPSTSRLWQLRQVVSKTMMQWLVSAFIWSCLDCCNLVLAGLLAVTLVSMQRVVNASYV